MINLISRAVINRVVDYNPSPTIVFFIDGSCACSDPDCDVEDCVLYRGVSQLTMPTCHCGKPVHIYDDLDGFTRDLCVDCSTVRCDAYPGECVDNDQW